MLEYKTGAAEIKYNILDNQQEPVIIWGHGWGQTHESFMPLAQSLGGQARHIVLDFPGFGGLPAPYGEDEEAWGSEDYAHLIAQFIRDVFPNQKIIWAGHSFGGRVGILLAALYPELVEKLILIAAAGLPRKRPLWQKIYFKALVWRFKILKKLALALKMDIEALRQTFGSADYKNAGEMRRALVKIVNENLSTQAEKIQCPALLIYGENDDQTPPEIGERYKSLIKNAEMVHLSGQDHYSVLASGQHQVAPLIKSFIGE